jgi:membrane-bound ClpP family serine protease
MFGNSRAQFIIVSIMGAAVWLKADRGVEIEYYKAAAQALPVLLLAFGLVAASFITFSVLAYKDAKLRAGRRTGSRQHSRHPSCRLDSHC